MKAGVVVHTRPTPFKIGDIVRYKDPFLGTCGSNYQNGCVEQVNYWFVWVLWPNGELTQERPAKLVAQ